MSLVCIISPESFMLPGSSTRKLVVTQVFYPGEICFVRWSISKGVLELYQVYLDPVTHTKHVTPKEWHEWCKTFRLGIDSLL